LAWSHLFHTSEMPFDNFAGPTPDYPSPEDALDLESGHTEVANNSSPTKRTQPSGSAVDDLCALAKIEYWWLAPKPGDQHGGSFLPSHLSPVNFSWHPMFFPGGPNPIAGLPRSFQRSGENFDEPK
jgi:hypothetical protein